MDTGKALVQAMERIESSRGLDPVADLIRLGVDGALPRGPVRDALRGDWLGHSFHPLLTDFVEGPWMAASFLDLFGPEGSARPARRCEPAPNLSPRRYGRRYCATARERIGRHPASRLI